MIRGFVTSPERLRAFREKADMTETALARKAGLATATVSRLEHGERDMSITTGRRLADALGVELPELVHAIPELDKYADEDLRYNLPVHCITCGAEIQVDQFAATPAFCSNECAQKHDEMVRERKAQREQEAAAKVYEKHVGREDMRLKCAICGKMFTPNKHGKLSHACSPTCRRVLANMKQRKGYQDVSRPR